MASSFMGGMGFDRRLRIHDELISRLKELGATDAQVSRAEAEWKKGIEVIYHTKIGDEMVKLPPGQTRPTVEHNALAEKIQELCEFSTWSVATPSAYQALAQKFNLFTPEVGLWIDDFSHFRQTNEIR
jgi:hypothetical protein